MTNTLPWSALLAAWTGAWLRGEAAADDLLDRLGPAHHVVLDAPGADGPEPILVALARLRRLGAHGAALALPAPGDPLGLAGPPRFNAAVLAAGEAVLLPGAGVGLVPTPVGGAVEWACAAAADPPWIDLAEADQALRRTLVEVTRRLVDLDVASWQPEVADALSDLRHRRTPPLPPSYDDRTVATVSRALMCLEVAALAADSTGGARTVWETDARRAALADLDRAARRALVAACR